MSTYDTKPEPVIGLDFGNCFSFPCFIPDMDAATRLGGTPRDLLPVSSVPGYPSVFFYSKSAADKSRRNGAAPPPWYGADAISPGARPADHRIRNLKRHLARPLSLDDWDGGYDEAIVRLMEHLVRQANKVLRTDWMLTSNMISLAYPATYTRAQCRHLKELAERATLEDGRNIEVVGMIAEPAAAALDYLVEHPQEKDETTVLTYDLGGGTFDLAIVSAYPKGRTRENGEIYYFDIEATGGIGNLGGNEFDEVMCELIRSKLPTGVQVPKRLREDAERMKIELSGNEFSELELQSADGDYFYVTVTRNEFIDGSTKLVASTLRATERILAAQVNNAPEMIILTGGASQMPVIKEALESKFPQFRGKVISYRPSRAVSYGAARYGTPNGMSGTQQRVPKDIGILFCQWDNKELIKVCIPAGTPLPFISECIGSETRVANQWKSRFVVCEATTEKPNIYQVDRDFAKVLEVTLYREVGAQTPVGTPTVSRLSLDKNGLLVVEAWDCGSAFPVRNECVLLI